MKHINSLKFNSGSAAETKKFGSKIGRLLKSGYVVALQGPLGAGKTTLVKGIAKGLEVSDEAEVLSPSFVLVREYEGREKIFHIDWYRLESVEGQDDMAAQECFDSPAVTLVEWAERGENILPDEYIRIEMEHAGPESRIIEVSVVGKKYDEFLKQIK